MEEYIAQVSILKDGLAAIVKWLKDYEIILITLGNLNEMYKSFVTSITIRFNHSMIFPMFCELLMDQNMQV